MLGLMFLPAVRPARRSHRAILAAAFVSIAAFGGCLDSGPSTLEDKEREGIGGTLKETMIPGNGSGTILGVVYDELFVPLSGVHVTLRGTSHYADTGADGRFAFRNLSVGTYVLRAAREGFKVFEGRVTIGVDAVTRVDIGLDPLERASAGFNRHRHDDWGTETSRSLLQGSPDFDLTPSGPEDRRIVFPGTRFLEVKIEWDPAEARNAYIDGVALRAVTANEPYSDNYTVLAPRGSGEPFRLYTSWETTDVGHARATAWVFELLLVLREPTIAGEDEADRLVFEYALSQVGQGRSTYGPFEITLIAHRGGALPLEPPHRDFWKGAEAAPVITSETNSKEPAATNITWRVVDDILVPPETQWLDVVLTQDRAPSVGSLDWGLSYRPGPVGPRHYGGICQYDDPRDRKASVEPVKTPTTWRWRIPLEEDQPDPFYAQFSTWCFWTAVEDQQAGYSPGFATYQWTDALVNGRIEVQLSVIAHRDPLA